MQFGSNPVGNQKYIRRHGAYAILPRQDAFLITYQGGSHNEFQLPGGGIDPGESPVAALHREVLEETGWTVSNVRFFHRFRFFTYMPDYDMWAEKICHIFTARPGYRQLSKPKEPEHSAHFVTQEEFPKILGVDGDRWCAQHFIKVQSKWSKG